MLSFSAQHSAARGAGMLRRRLARPLARFVSSFELMREATPNPAARRFTAMDAELSFLRPGAATGPAAAASSSGVEFTALTSPSDEKAGTAASGADANSDAIANRRLALSAPSVLEELARVRTDVANLLVRRDFVSVTLRAPPPGGEEAWNGIQGALERALEQDLGNGRWEKMLARSAEASGKSDLDISDPDSNSDSVAALVQDILNERVRPNLQSDGGDVEFRGFDEDTGVVRLRLVGACVGCPSSTVTMRFSIKNLLTHLVEEVKDVEQVFDDTDVVGDQGSNWTG